MKKILCLIMTMIMILSLAACGDKPTAGDANTPGSDAPGTSAEAPEGQEDAPKGGSFEDLNVLLTYEGTYTDPSELRYLWTDTDLSNGNCVRVAFPSREVYGPKEVVEFLGKYDGGIYDDGDELATVQFENNQGHGGEEFWFMASMEDMLIESGLADTVDTTDDTQGRWEVTAGASIGRKDSGIDPAANCSKWATAHFEEDNEMLQVYSDTAKDEHVALYTSNKIDGKYSDYWFNRFRACAVKPLGDEHYLFVTLDASYNGEYYERPYRCPEEAQREAIQGYLLNTLAPDITGLYELDETFRQVIGQEGVPIVRED